MNSILIVLILSRFAMAARINDCPPCPGVSSSIDQDNAVDVLQIFGVDDPKNTTRLFVFTIPEGFNCDNIGWCNEKCKKVLQEPVNAFCHENCFCIKF